MHPSKLVVTDEMETRLESSENDDNDVKRERFLAYILGLPIGDDNKTTEINKQDKLVMERYYEQLATEIDPHFLALSMTRASAKALHGVTKDVLVQCLG